VPRIASSLAHQEGRATERDFTCDKGDHMSRITGKAAAMGGMLALSIAGGALASSHREAPFITELPKVDGTDVYAFRSYEPGRAGFVTIIANYLPLQDAYGAPNYFNLDPDALYEIHIDNNGDAVEDLTFQFRFSTLIRGLALSIGGQQTEVPIVQTGPIGASGSREDIANSNAVETFQLGLVRGPRRASAAQPVLDGQSGSATFRKPVDYIGTRTLPNYAAYANDHIRPITIPGCATQGRVFVGQRTEGFYINIGQIFDLLNFQTLRDGQPPRPFTPIGEANRAAGQNVIADKNITALTLELPISCITSNGEPVIGVWSTASLPRNRVLNNLPTRTTGPTAETGEFVQVSRLGSPLINELIIGVPDKDRFNNSEPKNDAQFLRYVTNPSLPALIEIVFGAAGVRAPTLFPRTDLIATYLTGLNIPGAVSTQPRNVVPSEMLRLNTSTAPVPVAQQNRLGVLAGDMAGFPNGRRPNDDIIDGTLRVAMGRLISLGLFGQPSQAPSGALDFTDGALNTTPFLPVFPYLAVPQPGDLTK
jgi:hypothetical protein